MSYKQLIVHFLWKWIWHIT